MAIKIFFSTGANVGGVTRSEQIPYDGPVPEWPDGWHVTVLEETGSTNTDLAAAATAGAPDHSVLVAMNQTAGRGRLDRRWEAPAGANLLVSVLFREVPDPAVELTHRIGLAATATARRLAGVDARLKWPNDVVVDDRKLGGILAQQTASGAVVVGLGLNLGWAPPEAALLGADLDPLTVLRALLAELDALPADSLELAERYRSELSTLGRRVRVDLADGHLVGTAVGVADDGRLIVVDECAVSHRIDVGDVVHLRSEVPPT